MKRQKERMSAETFNTLVAALALVVVAVGVVLAMRMATWRSCEEKKTVSRPLDIPQGNVPYRMTDVRLGAFVIPSDASPWRQEEVAAVEMLTLSAQTLYDKAVPYIAVKPSLRARPEPLFAIAAMAEDMPRAEGVKIQIDRGYMTWQAAGSEAGRTPYHTGYRLTISIAVEGEGTMTLAEALKHPVASSPAAWLAANFTSYGFVTVGDGGSQIHYVGTPHAAAIQKADKIPAYLNRVREVRQDTPLVYECEEGVYHVFYVRASYGAAVVYVSNGASVSSSGDGDGGFIVALCFPRS